MAAAEQAHSRQTQLTTPLPRGDRHGLDDDTCRILGGAGRNAAAIAVTRGCRKTLHVTTQCVPELAHCRPAPRCSAAARGRARAHTTKLLYDDPRISESGASTRDRSSLPSPA